MSFGGPGRTIVARRLARPLERLRGLLLTRPDARPVLLEGCASIHTFGMAYPIDVAFLASDGTCVLSVRGVVPGRVVSARGATRVLERPACAGPWPARGEQVMVSPARRRDLVGDTPPRRGGMAGGAGPQGGA